MRDNETSSNPLVDTKNKKNIEKTILKEKITELSSELHTDLIEQGVHPLHNIKMYEFLMKLNTESRDQLLIKYSDSKKEYDNFKKELGEKFTICLFHPGIRVRQQQFVEFVKEIVAKNKELTPFQAIQLFSENLGTVNLYRGMALTEEEVLVIGEFGILAPALIKQERAIKALSTLLDPDIEELDWQQEYPPSFSRDLVSRLTNISMGRANSISSSTSTHAEVAASVGWFNSGKTAKEDVAPYVFELQIPKILTYQESDFTKDIRGPEKIQIGNDIFTRAGLEIFVPFGITPNFIAGYHKIETPSPWRFVS